ncbi:MAG: hypothetical protein ACMUEK_02755 [Sodalis sp. (in: enterobacteria)]
MISRSSLFLPVIKFRGMAKIISGNFPKPTIKNIVKNNPTLKQTSAAQCVRKSATLTRQKSNFL